MVTLNDYLYSGNTVLKILHNYYDDLKKEADVTGNEIDAEHCAFLLKQINMLENNEFLTSQSQRIREFYMFMVNRYPHLAFTFKGRIKSLIRAEEKFNGYIVEYVYDYYIKNGSFPDLSELKEKLSSFRDLIAYRIIISMPKCHIEPGKDRKEVETALLYEIADAMPAFLAKRGFSAKLSELKAENESYRLSDENRPYFRDYIENPAGYGYQSLHITFFDNLSDSYIEVQLRTKEMDDYAEIGPANHLGYEMRQADERTRRFAIPEGRCIVFDEAYEREVLLQQLDLSGIDVNMFGAVNNTLINDGCGLYRGRLILPFEHLSRFQNDR